MNQQAGTSAKKPYQAPKLLVYGNLSEMTQANSSMGALDGGSQGAKRKTGAAG